MKESTWVGRPAGAPTVDADNPWPGLAAFREADQAFFRGRDSVLEELLRLVLRSPVTVLFAVSGLGKTSLLRAGLFPVLRQNGILPVYVRLQHGEGGPGLREQVLAALTRAAEDASVEAVEPDPDADLWEYLHRKDVRFWNERNRLVTPILVFDQFEEIFTIGAAHPERRARSDAFLSELADVVEARPPAAVKALLEQDPEEALRYSLTDRPCKVLISLREDFLAELTGLASRMPSLAHHAFRLQRMNQDEALRVVQVQGLVPEDVARRVVEFVAAGDEPGGGTDEAAPVEPALLSVFCRELNHKRRAQGRATITADLVEGNAGTIIADFYQRTISDPRLGPGVRRLVEEKLLTQSGFRNSLAEEEALLEPGVTSADIDRLIELRLLRREETGTRGYSRIELTHDVLTEPIRASRDRRRVREQEERKLAALREMERQERRRTDEARRRRFLAALAILTLIAIVSAVLAIRQKGLANRELSASDVERVLLGDSEPLPHLARAVAKDPDNDLPRAALFMQLASAVPEVGLLHHARGVATAAFAGSADRDRVLVVVVAADGSAHLVPLALGLAPAQVDADSHPPFATGVVRLAVSRNGSRAVTAAADGTVRGWRLSSDAEPLGDSLPPFSALGGVADLQITADGTRAAVATFDGQVRAWTTSGEVNVVSLSIAPPAIPGKLQFDASGTRLLTLAAEGAQVWDTATGSAVASPLDHAGEVLDASFSPDGGRLLAVVPSDHRDTTAAAGRVQVWDANSGALVSAADSELTHEQVQSAVFAPGGAVIATTSAGGLVRVWDVGTGAPVGTPMRHDAAVRQVAFSWDGSRLLTVSEDRSVRLWNPQTGDAVGWPLRHHAPVTEAAFSDGSRIVTRTRARASLWDGRGRAQAGASTFRLPESAAAHVGIVATTFTASGTRVVTVSSDGTTTLWDARTGASGSSYTVGERAPGPQPAVAIAAFDPKEVVFATASERRAALWNVVGGAAIGRPMEHADRITSVDFDPSGRFLVTASMDRTAQLWSARTGERIGNALHDGDTLAGALFSDAGTEVVTTSTSGSVHVWDVRGALSGRVTDSRPSMLKVDAVTIARPSHGRVFTGGADGALRAWSARTGASMGPPLRHPGAIRTLVVSRDGSRLATVANAAGMAEPMVRLWDVPVGTAGDVSLLRQVAEVLEGHRVGDDGVLGPVSDGERRQALDRLRARRGTDDVAGRFVRWLLASPRDRAVTPLSSLTLSKYMAVLSRQPAGALQREAQHAFGWLGAAPAPAASDPAQGRTATSLSEEEER